MKTNMSAFKFQLTFNLLVTKLYSVQTSLLAGCGLHSGDLRLCGPRKSRGTRERDDPGQDILMIPTDAIGCNPRTHRWHYAHIISLNWPNRLADKGLEGKLGDISQPPVGQVPISLQASCR